MAGSEAPDWVSRLDRELEPLRHSWQRFAREAGQVSAAVAAARDKWRPTFEAWQQLFRAFVAARDRGYFRDLQLRLRLTLWIVQRIEEAKDNPSHRMARAWLTEQHRTPKQIAELLPYMMMDMPELRIPKRRGRRKGRIAPSMLKMVQQLDERIKRTGELRTTAARRLLADLGFRGQNLKGRADYLVRLWKNRAFKSG
jgi:hypothetical protein